jgi:hypothetical protein
METARREANRKGIAMIGLGELQNDPLFRLSADASDDRLFSCDYVWTRARA